MDFDNRPIFSKKNKCEYCFEKMESKNRNKRFCSVKCRVYFARKKKNVLNYKNIPPANPQIQATNDSFWGKLKSRQ